MDNLSAEVGHKMRSAVKAKLIELGTGGSAGYIDDELPDYVMIMVANKRSKQQMTEDLALFLGSNTDVFVGWLHQVLQKLQEVAIPTTTVVQKGKRKPSESTDRKEKKDKKKKLKRSHKVKDVEATTSLQQTSTPPPETLSLSPRQPPPSITDVFADHLIQRARTNMSLEQSVNVKTKKEHNLEGVGMATGKKSSDDFDIPTITEIAENAVGKVNRRKEISALADLQRKINQAKRQLKALGSEESEDEDFINIKDDADEELAAEDDETGLDPSLRKASQVSEESQPEAVADKLKTSSGDKIIESRNNANSRPQRVPITFRDPFEGKPVSHIGHASTSVGGSPKKRSIMERLGVRPTSRENVVSLSAHRRMEKEIYVPVFRRKEDDRKTERERESRTNERSTIKLSRDLRDRVKERDRKNVKDSKVDSKLKRLVESRVIVAPPKPDYDEDSIEVPVNSIVKIQPRPVLPTNKQASKNLLLRAVAEAQKSTALVKPREEIRSKSPLERNQKLYSKSYRDKKSGLIKSGKNIVIEVDTNVTLSSPSYTQDEHIEYVPHHNDDSIINADDSDDVVDGYVYIPLNISSGNSDDNMDSSVYESDTEKKHTQFVVTLDEAENAKYVPQPISKSHRERNRSVVNGIPEQYQPKEKVSSPVTVELTTTKVNKLIIKNDTEDEEELRKEVERSTTAALSNRSKRSHVSPIKFDIKSEEESKRTKTSNHNEHERARNSKDRSSDDAHRVTTKRVDVSKKYENLPPLSSGIATVDSVTSKSKAKDRCKYYPACGKGDNCEFSHPNACKQFPNCKYGDQCLYTHPRCKFDLTCTRHSCNFSHSTTLATTAPPISSHVVPVTNYKSITNTPLPAMCKFYPKCTNVLCTFFHPKPCRFGKNCANKVECNFYHFDVMPAKDKLKWVASSTVY